MFPNEVSFIGFGTYNFMGTQMCDGKNLGWPELDIAHKKDLLKFAISLGINFIDTSDFYGLGDVESLIGDVIGDNNDIRIATKGGKVDGYINGRIARDFSPMAIRLAIDASRSRLKRDKIDLYQLHGPSMDDLLNMSLWDVLFELQEKGSIDEIGVSLPSDSIKNSFYIDSICTNPLIKFVQMPLNLVSVETLCVADRIRSSGKYVISRSHFEHGLIFKKDDFSDLDHYDPRQDFLSINYSSVLRSRVLKTKKIINEFLEKHKLINMSPAQFILLAIKSSNVCDIALCGASKILHLEENSAALGTNELDSKIFADFQAQLQKEMIGERIDSYA